MILQKSLLSNSFLQHSPAPSLYCGERQERVALFNTNLVRTLDRRRGRRTDGQRRAHRLTCTARLAPGTQTEVYIIKKGDWLSDVAAARNIDVYDLKDINPSLDLDNVYVGQKIMVPVSAPAPSTGTGSSGDKAGGAGPLLGNLFGKQEGDSSAKVESKSPKKSVSKDMEVYVMQRGEWVSNVAIRFGVSLEELRAANPGINLDNVRPKQEILIPKPRAAPPPSFFAPLLPSAPSPAPAPSTPPSPQRVTNRPTTTTRASEAAETCSPPARPQSPGLRGSGREGEGSDRHGGKRQGTASSTRSKDDDMCCPPSPPPGKATEVYVVKRGDWMSSIAADRGVSLEELRQLNLGVNLDRINTGQSIMVPVKGSSTKTSSGQNEGAPLEYMVQPGDAMGAIASRHGVTIDDIVELNGFSYNDTIQVGQTLLIPRAKTVAVQSAPADSTWSRPRVPLTTAAYALFGVGAVLVGAAAVGSFMGGSGAWSGSGQGQVRGRQLVVGGDDGSTREVAGTTSYPTLGQPSTMMKERDAGAAGGGVLARLDSSSNGTGAVSPMTAAVGASSHGNVNGNGSGYSKTAGANGGNGLATLPVGRASRVVEGAVQGLPRESERVAAMAVAAVRGGGEGVGMLQVGDGYARGTSAGAAMQEAVRSALLTLGTEKATLALAAVGGDSSAWAGIGGLGASSKRVEESLAKLRASLPRECAVHGLAAGGPDPPPAGSSGSDGSSWAAVLILSAPAVLLPATASTDAVFGAGSAAPRQAMENIKAKVAKKPIKALIVTSSSELVPVAIDEAAGEFPGVPIYGVTASRGSQQEDWRVPSGSGASAGVSVIAVAKDAEFGGAFLATVIGQWLYGARSVVRARPPLATGVGRS